MAYSLCAEPSDVSSEPVGGGGVFFRGKTGCW